jgi:hypothetical protein
MLSSENAETCGKKLSPVLCVQRPKEEFSFTQGKAYALRHSEVTVSQAERPPFVRRLNRDGTIDSICSKCVLTVATSRHEHELHALEQAHQCDPTLLEYWKSLSGTKSGKKPTR